jgi:hypothetical protein
LPGASGQIRRAPIIPEAAAANTLLETFIIYFEIRPPCKTQNLPLAQTLILGVAEDLPRGGVVRKMPRSNCENMRAGILHGQEGKTRV